MKSYSKKYIKYLEYALLFLVIIGLLITFSDLNKLKNSFLRINYRYLCLSLLSSLLVYCLEGFFLLIALRVFDEKITILNALKYSLIINSTGYLVSLGGLTPFATQVYILNHDNISTKKATLTRILQVILFNLLFDILLVFGIIYILLYPNNAQLSITTLFISLFVFLSITMVVYLTSFSEPFRKVSLKLTFLVANKVIRIFSKKINLDYNKALVYFNEFNVGFKSLISKPRYLILIISIIVIDWVLWISVLYFSFLAMNYHINVGYLVIGFAIGQLVGIASMVPGGAGTMEGSMALVFKAFGVPIETSLATVLLYRVSFNIIPFLLSLPLYLRLKKRNREDKI